MPPPVYAFAERALRRWATQHLRVAGRPDGEIEAVFHFEGSTCGNVPLMTRYSVHLGAAATGYEIRALRLEPLSESEGQLRQCAYESEGVRFLRWLDQEKPCLGESLESALSWAPPTSPAGCLCTEESRAHKWRIVFHTLHYALHGSGEVVTIAASGHAQNRVPDPTPSSRAPLRGGAVEPA